MLQTMTWRHRTNRRIEETEKTMLRHQVQGAQRNGLWTRASAVEPGGLPSVDSAAQRTAVTSSEEMRDRLNQVYENYYNAPWEHGAGDTGPSEHSSGGAENQLQDNNSASQSITIGGENFGALRQAIAFVTRARALSAHAAAKVHDEDGEHDAGKLLPIWVIVRLKIKLERARHSIMARNEGTRQKHAIVPDGRPKTIWDLVTTLLLVLTLFEIPLEIAFLDAGCEFTNLTAFNLVVDIIFCLDIAVAFHTGFMIKVGGQDILEDNHYLIAQRYMRGWFAVDFVSSIPLERFVCLALTETEATADEGQESSGTDVLKVFKVARFLKLVRLVRFNRMLNKWQAMSIKKWQLNFTRLFKLIIFLLMVGHFMACSWQFLLVTHDCGVWTTPQSGPDHKLSDTQMDVRYGCECNPLSNNVDADPDSMCTPVNWLAKYDMELFTQGRVEDRYFTSLYFTIIGLTTVGFGDISPANFAERLYSIIMTLVGAVVFAIVIGSVSEIAQQGNHFEVALGNTVHMISDFLEHRNVPDDVLKRIIEHITYASHKAPQLYTPDQFALLPRGLRKKLLNHLINEQLGTVVQTFPLFNNMDHELRLNFLILLRPILLMDAEYLYEALDVGREGFILLQGILEQWKYQNQFGHMAMDDIKIKEAGEMVGESGLLDDGPPYRYTSMRSYGNSELLEITKEDFDRHIKPNFPDVYKAITEMALSRLTGPGSKEALMAMRSRSIRRCATIKQKTRKDPLTGKLLFGDEEQTVFGNDDNVKDKGKPPRGACQFSPSLKITVTEGEPPPLSVHAPSPTANLEAAGEDFGASAKVSLESRMGNLENAVRTLTELVVRIDKKLDEKGHDSGGSRLPPVLQRQMTNSMMYFP